VFYLLTFVGERRIDSDSGRPTLTKIISLSETDVAIEAIDADDSKLSRVAYQVPPQAPL
jgi:hypothetical protein